MIDKLILFSIKNKFVIGLFIIALIAWGSYSVTQLPIDAVPDITNNQVQLITVSPSNGAEDIELQAAKVGGRYFSTVECASITPEPAAIAS